MLRIYERLEIFDLDTQARWIDTSPNAPTKKLESESVIKNLISCDRLIFSQEGAHFIDCNGKRFVCPWSLKTRSVAAMQEFKKSTPSTIIPFFIPAEMETLLSEEEVTDNRIPHIISERWIIPPRWFALFRTHERLVSRQNSETTCIYITELSRAKERCIETHNIVRNAFGNGLVEAEVAELLNWMNVFDESSLIELDYGGLASLLDTTLRSNGGGGIHDDTSVDDALASILGLSRGDGVLAGEAYGRLVSRWRQIASIEQAQ